MDIVISPARVTTEAARVAPPDDQLHRTIDWKGAFWVASGVPALVLFSIGGIAGAVGTPAFAVWAVSMCLGFVQSFTYAEIAGLFPNKSGGAAVYRGGHSSTPGSSSATSNAPRQRSRACGSA